MFVNNAAAFVFTRRQNICPTWKKNCFLSTIPSLREQSTKKNIQEQENCFEFCVSGVVAPVVAGADNSLAKHGERSISDVYLNSLCALQLVLFIQRSFSKDFPPKKERKSGSHNGEFILFLFHCFRFVCARWEIHVAKIIAPLVKRTPQCPPIKALINLVSALHITSSWEQSPNNESGLCSNCWSSSFAFISLRRTNKCHCGLVTLRVAGKCSLSAALWNCSVICAVSLAPYRFHW